MAMRKQSGRVHSINFDPSVDEWVESLVSRLVAIGYPKAGRSGVVREALWELRQKLADCSDGDILRYFVERDAARLLTSVDRTPVAPREDNVPESAVRQK